MKPTLISLFIAVLTITNCKKHTFDEKELRRMIGQMIMVGFRGTEVTCNDEIIKEFHDLNIGGTVLFDYDVKTRSRERNIISREQVKKLNRALQACAQTPLFTAVDQEGGKVARLKPRHGYKEILSHAELGERDDPELTRSTAKLVANQIASSGFNINLAPVVDLNINKDNPVIGKLGRSISDDPDVVIKHAEIFIEEHSKQNVLTCIKHFMGHGSSKEDSHVGFVDVTESYDEREMIPYRELIKKGVVDMVMTAHVFNRNYDETYPFTLSKHVITDILRKEMGFDSVVTSDDMQMKAITENYGFEEAVLKAVDAGVDIILIANNVQYDPTAHIRAFNAIYNGVENGRLTYGRIKESYDRIMKLKGKIDILK